MLTRLKVDGFKNLASVDVRFGPFTCIAGANGVGKSNLFDAITFLRLLATEPLVVAALSVRDEEGRSGDIRSLFLRSRGYLASTMRFEAEMVVPKRSLDDFRQVAEASNTLLRYVLELRYRGEEDESGPLEIIEESLDPVNKGEATGFLRFPHSASEWRQSVLVAKRKAKAGFISTLSEPNGERTIIVHQDQKQGRPQRRSAAQSPRTVLSLANTSETPTAVVARSEMRSWNLLQLEPSALRRSDPIRAPRQVGADGAHMAATLHSLIHNGHKSDAGNGVPDIPKAIASRLSELVEDVTDVWVDEDARRELLTLHARLRDGSDHPARSLSDGTLRFLALAIIEHSTQSNGVFCLEEPENGIHPERIPAMINLLQSIATDTSEPVGKENPLRQVIINTHSPSVVACVPGDSLLIAEPTSILVNDCRTRTVRFGALSDTWRTRVGANGSLMPAISKGRLLEYLNPIARAGESRQLRCKRVVDHNDAQMLPFYREIADE